MRTDLIKCRRSVRRGFGDLPRLILPVQGEACHVPTGDHIQLMGEFECSCQSSSGLGRPATAFGVSNIE
jgi:hypothetical protein